VRTAGFVLTGFPSSTQHAAFLKKSSVWLRHVVHLKLDPAAAKAKVLGTRYDPVDGEIYHADTNGALDEATAARLVTHPKDEPKAFKLAMNTWSASLAGMAKAFADQLLEEDASRSERELVERLTPCFLSL